MTIEPWDVFDTWPIEQRIGAYRAGVLKYTMRLGTKGKRGDDAKKARHYAEKLEEVTDPTALVEGVETTAPEDQYAVPAFAMPANPAPDWVTCAGCREDVCPDAMMLSVSYKGLARLRCPRCMEVSS